MKRQITGIAAASTVLLGVASHAAEITPTEALELTVVDFDKIEEQEKGPAIYHVLTVLYNYYTANSEERKAACMVNLYKTPIAEGSKTSVLMTDIGYTLEVARKDDPSAHKLADVVVAATEANCSGVSTGGE